MPPLDGLVERRHCKLRHHYQGLNRWRVCSWFRPLQSRGYFASSLIFLATFFAICSDADFIPLNALPLSDAIAHTTTPVLIFTIWMLARTASRPLPKILLDHPALS